MLLYNLINNIITLNTKFRATYLTYILELSNFSTFKFFTVGHNAFL
ncbi:hypothetical protein GCM10008921_25970 [Metaclostridioides mangenotii]